MTGQKQPLRSETRNSKKSTPVNSKLPTLSPDLATMKPPAPAFTASASAQPNGSGINLPSHDQLKRIAEGGQTQSLGLPTSQPPSNQDADGAPGGLKQEIGSLQSLNAALIMMRGQMMEQLKKSSAHLEAAKRKSAGLTDRCLQLEEEVQKLRRISSDNGSVKGGKKGREGGFH
mmetsp:Transcript_5188/g.8324  ORF Transcript_5188/g.8324 Transcript_5188/m.8324 type:complete len:174 (-) Transcript_5188:562-1083(-)